MTRHSPPSPSTQCWFDAHLDLASLAVCGRDMFHADPRAAGGPFQPGAVTLPALVRGGVRACLATIFTESGGNASAPDGALAYAPGDAQAAHKAGLRQLEVYAGWRHAHERGRSDVPALAILMECADPIREPAEASWWIDQGVRCVGLAWARGSRYAGGNTQAHGLTPLGRELIAELDRLGVVHDQSHLSDAGTDELFEATDRLVVATHSNLRSLVDAQGINQRHLRERTVREIAARGGVIGLNLFSRFLAPRGEGATRRATIAEAIDHVERICELVGHDRAVGLGSDMDGGLTADDLPEGMQGPSDLGLLSEELRRRGWNDHAIEGFAWRNWARVFPGVMPLDQPRT